MSSFRRTRSGKPIRMPLARIAFLACTVAALALSVRPARAFEPWWVQNHTETQLWSGPDDRAVPFGQVPQWSYFRVVAPQNGPRLYVYDPRTDNYAYIDAKAVGPSSPPPLLPQPAATSQPPGAPAGAQAPTSQRPLRSVPKVASDYQPWWVANFVETEFWSGPGSGATSLGRVPQFRRFLVIEPQNGDRLHVWSPEKDLLGYLDAATLGPSGPSVWMSALAPRVAGEVHLPGRSVGSKTYLRNLPVYDDETELRYLPNNTPLDIKQAVVAADGSEWYTVGDGQYILASEVRLPRPVEKTLPGRWIDADLTEPAMVTAYEGSKIVYSALAIKGFAATPTLKGSYQIWRRVENETMDSETLSPPIPHDAPGGYLLKDVLYTQYFTHDGASLHYNYWLGTFGYPGSHGCLGLNLEDAKWFWDWASIGTPIVIR